MFRPHGVKQITPDSRTSLSLTLLGDLKHGRTVHSLALLVARLSKPPRLALVSPTALRMPSEVLASIVQSGAEAQQSSELSSELPRTDVLYVTRARHRPCPPGALCSRPNDRPLFQHPVTASTRGCRHLPLACPRSLRRQRTRTCSYRLCDPSP